MMISSLSSVNSVLAREKSLRGRSRNKENMHTRENVVLLSGDFMNSKGREPSEVTVGNAAVGKRREP